MDPLLRAGPRAELLTVVRVHDELRASSLPLAKLLHRLADIAERDEVAQAGAGRVQDEREALILGDEGFAEVLATESALEEVVLVEDSVRDAGLGKDRRQVRLPDALGEPRAERAPAEDRRDAISERADLADRIATRHPNQDGLVVAAREQLDLAALHE